MHFFIEKIPMNETSEPKKLAKIWRMIKWPLRQIKQGLYSLRTVLYRLAYKKVATRNDILFSELETTESIVLRSLNAPVFIEKTVDSIIPKVLNNPVFLERLLKFQQPLLFRPNQEIWNDFFRSKPEELKKNHDKLVAGTDELSHEVVARYIERRRFCMEHGNNVIAWSVLSNLILRQKYPLDYADQEHIKALGEAYVCPYRIPSLGPWKEHIATDFSLNQLPQAVQEKIVNKDIIDGGGYSGDSAMVFTAYNPRRVFTFEPNPDTIPGMQQVIMDNAGVLGDKKNLIEIVPMALGKSKGTFMLYSHGAFDAGATTSPHGQGRKTAHEVNIISIDEFVETHSLDVGLIKLDVEGAEYDTILGAKETIIRQKPLLIISIYHTFKDFFEIKPLIESWGIDYKFEIRYHLPAMPDTDFMLLAY